jgi:hypothetical protein
MMTEALMVFAHAQDLQQRFRAVLTGQLEPGQPIWASCQPAGVLPSRIKCALLGSTR